MTNFKKRISIAACAAAASLAITTMAGATTTYETTSGGTGGAVRIRSQISSDERNPAGNIIYATYKVTSDIYQASTLKTNFQINATLFNSNSSKSFSQSGFANSVTAISSESGPNVALYNYLESTTTTYSDAFGTSTQRCNGSV